MHIPTLVASATYCTAVFATYIGDRIDDSVKSSIKQTDGQDLVSPVGNNHDSPDGLSSPLLHDGASSINGENSTSSGNFTSGAAMFHPGYLIGVVCLVGIL